MFVLDWKPRRSSAGIGTHLTTAQMLVIGPQGPLSPNHFRFPDEPVRHKVLDLIGDLKPLWVSRSRGA